MSGGFAAYYVQTATKAPNNVVLFAWQIKQQCLMGQGMSWRTQQSTEKTYWND